MKRFALALLTLACSAIAVAADPTSTFTFRIIGEPETLDWNRAHTPVENYLMINLMEGLVIIDENLKPQPAMAESWKVSPDGKTYTFKLRSGLKWSDGVAVKAQDFVFSWQRLLSPATAASYAYFLFDVENAEAFYKGELKDFAKVGVKAPDDRTVVVRLTSPIAHWIYIPSFWVTFPLRQDIVEKFGAGWARPGKMVTAGPYVLAEHVIENKIVLRENPHYYGKRTGNVKEAVALIVKDDSTAVTLFEAGNLDYMTDVPALELKRLAGRKELKAYPYLKTGYLGFHTAATGAKVRRAIAMGFDKGKFADLLHGGQKPATSFIPPKMAAYSAKVGLPFDVKRAREELKGVDTSQPLKLLIPNWERPVTIAQFLQEELKKNLGLTVTIEPFDHKTFRAQLGLKGHSFFVLSWGADYPDPDNFLSLWLSDSGNNKTGFKHAKYDELVLKGRHAKPGPARDKLYVEAQKILLEQEAAIIPLYYDTQGALLASRVKKFDLNPINYFYLKQVLLDR
jgi:oligopeptide transport system substrate-binding protein